MREGIKDGAAVANERMSSLLAELKRKKDYLNVQLPVQWAQSLHNVFLEVRYAHRHDAPGCSNFVDEQVALTEDRLKVSVLCLDATSRVKYHLDLALWDQIDVERSHHEYQTVGRRHFTLAKRRGPARWLHLYAEARPINYRLWLEQHERHVGELWQHDGDAIDKFEGYQWMEDEEEAYQEQQHRK